jgi:hypothetical protein
MNTGDFEQKAIQAPENKIVIHDELSFIGEVLDMLMPLDDDTIDKNRQDEVIKDFMKSISHYQEAYFAYLRVKTDRAREIVGIPYYTDESGRDVELEATG